MIRSLQNNDEKHAAYTKACFFIKITQEFMINYLFINIILFI
ncbi:hypothetical protein PEC302107_36220 [Pectobacterium araliae]|nr:hypothetical protein PEC302107_36220 [Pectobacterium carotovorum subsp. carotovorum]